MDACTDAYNLTDCLLGQVLDASKEHNKWDIPSLAVTVIIGVVALIFAFATIWQASTGLGRRKSSGSAIGDWAAFTRHRWNLPELSREAIAYTPVITTTMLQHIAETGIKSQMASTDLKMSRKWKIETCMKDTARSCLNIKQSPGTRPFGTWLQFLKHTGMERFVWCNPYQVKQTNADYLPSGFQAAPAYMQLDVVIALAAAAGCYTMTIGPGESYPRITGASAVVRFRLGTSLGAVGSFESFESTESDRELERQLEDTGMNDILLWDNPLEWLRSNFQETKEGNWPIQYNEKLHCHSDPNVESQIHGRHGEALSLCQCSGILRYLIRQHDSLWLLCALPFEQREAFPAERANVERTLATLVVQGSLWSTSSLYETDLIECLGYKSWENFSDQIEWISNTEESKLASNSTKSGWTEALNIPNGPQASPRLDKGVVPSESSESSKQRRHPRRQPLSEWELFVLCFRLLVTDAQTVKKDFFRLPRHWRISIRRKITEQIKAIDKELDRYADTVCIRIQTSIISAALMQLEPHEEDVMIIAKDLREKASSYDRLLAAGRSPGPRALTDRTARNILAMLKIVNQDEGDSLIQLYYFFINIIFSGCSAQQVDVLMQSLFNLRLTNPSERIWKKHLDTHGNPQAFKRRYKDPIDFVLKRQVSTSRDPVAQNPAMRNRIVQNKAPQVLTVEDSAGQNTTEQTLVEKDIIRELLIYRSVLFAFVCLTAIDNSAIFESSIRNHIIPFI